MYRATALSFLGESVEVALYYDITSERKPKGPTRDMLEGFHLQNSSRYPQMDAGEADGAKGLKCWSAGSVDQETSS